MGYSEVKARWLVISICMSVGSAISNMIAGVDGATVCGRQRARGLERCDGCTLIEEEVAERGLQHEFLKYPL